MILLLTLLNIESFICRHFALWNCRRNALRQQNENNCMSLLLALISQSWHAYLTLHVQGVHENPYLRSYFVPCLLTCDRFSGALRPRLQRGFKTASLLPERAVVPPRWSKPFCKQQEPALTCNATFGFFLRLNANGCRCLGSGESRAGREGENSTWVIKRAEERVL